MLLAPSPRNADAGSKVVFVSLYQSTSDAGLVRSHDAVGDEAWIEQRQRLVAGNYETSLKAGMNRRRRIEVHHQIVFFDERRDQFITQSEVESDGRSNLVVILDQVSVFPVRKDQIAASS